MINWCSEFQGSKTSQRYCSNLCNYLWYLFLFGNLLEVSF